MAFKALFAIFSSHLSHLFAIFYKKIKHKNVNTETNLKNIFPLHLSLMQINAENILPGKTNGILKFVVQASTNKRQGAIYGLAVIVEF